MKSRAKSKITIPKGVVVWPHELRTAQALVGVGYSVTFLKSSHNQHSKSPDVIINGIKWEIKSPKTDKLSAIERNLKKASKQSANIILDSQRMKKLHDSTIQRVIAEKLATQKTIKRILFVNRKRDVIDITTLF